MGSVLSTQRLRFGYCSGTNHVSIYKKSFLCKNYSKTAGTIVHGILSLSYDEEKIRQYKNGRLVRNQWRESRVTLCSDRGQGQNDSSLSHPHSDGRIRVHFFLFFCREWWIRDCLSLLGAIDLIYFILQVIWHNGNNDNEIGFLLLKRTYSVGKYFDPYVNCQRIVITQLPPLVVVQLPSLVIVTRVI